MVLGFLDQHFQMLSDILSDKYLNIEPENDNRRLLLSVSFLTAA